MHGPWSRNTSFGCEEFQGARQSQGKVMRRSGQIINDEAETDHMGPLVGTDKDISHSYVWVWRRPWRIRGRGVA